MINEPGIVSAEDSVALLREGIAVLSIEELGGRPQVCVVGRDEERVRRVVTERMGDVDVWVPDNVCVSSTAHVAVGETSVFGHTVGGVDHDWEDLHNPPAGVPHLILDGDLGAAALNIPRDACREFAASRSWGACAQAFIDNVTRERPPQVNRRCRRRLARMPRLTSDTLPTF